MLAGSNTLQGHPYRAACSTQPVPQTLTWACWSQVSIPLWALVHLPVVVTITTAVFTPKGWLHCILYVLFENAMGIVKLWAVIAGPATPPIVTCHCLRAVWLCLSRGTPSCRSGLVCRGVQPSWWHEPLRVPPRQLIC